jgi:ABC-2 type transport system permease protein
MVKRKLRDIIKALLGITVLVLLNVLGAFVFHRIDLTEDQRYSLSEVTTDQASNLEDVIFVRVYLEGDLPADYKRLRDATQELLDEYRAYSGDNLQYEFIDPTANPNQKEREKVYRKLVKEGIQPTTLSEQSIEESKEKVIFPGAVVTYGNRSIAWQILKPQMGVPEPIMINNSIQQLEYELASIVSRISKPNKKRIAYIEGHGEYDELEVADLNKTLEEQYYVERVKIDGQLNSLRIFDLIVIAGPDSAFTEKDKFIIDQFIMKGGKSIWLYEPVSIDLDSLKQAPFTMALPRDLNLDDMLFRYGVRVNRNLILDLQCLPLPIVVGQVGNTPRQELRPWYYFPLVIPRSNHPIAKNLDGIKSEFASNIDYVGRDTSIKKTTLLSTSQYTRLVTTPNRVSFNILRQKPDKRQYNLSHEKIAVLLEGTFPSNFKNRLTADIAENDKIAFREVSYPTAQIVIADADIIRNRVNWENKEYYALGHDRYTRRIYANKDFMLNCVNYLLDDQGLLELRSKEFKMRLLDRPRIEKEKTKWQMANLFVPVMVIMLLGGLSFYVRQRKYAKKS